MAFVAVIANAQTMQEVVYLKNGSVIRGIIIEQTPNVSLKVQTSDGSIFAYQMDEVEKITKEVMDTSHRNTMAGRTSSGGLKMGYRGFVDFGGGIGVGDWGDGRVGVTTSHGFQVCPYFFVGAGFGVNYHVDWEVVEIPIFLHLRSEFLNNAISPFFDFKVGYSPYDGQGAYVYPSVGCRIGVLGNKAGLSLSIGYEMQMLDMYVGYSRYWDEEKNPCGAIAFKLAFDF